MPRILNYLNSRELGKVSVTKTVPITECITSQSNHKPLFAETSISSKTTFLIKLNCDSKYLAAAHGNKSVAVYDSITGEFLAYCHGHERHPWTLAFHPNHPYLLASGCLAGNLRLWDLSCLSKRNVNDPPLMIQAKKVWHHIGAVASLDFHPVHPILVAAWTQEVAFYDWVSGRSLSVWRFVSDHSRVRWVKFSPNGSLLYTATANPPCHSNNGLNLGRTEASSRNNAQKSVDSEKQRLYRSELLDFMISKDAKWFKSIGVCQNCVHRILVWIGTFNADFPSTSTDVNIGLLKVKKSLEKYFVKNSETMSPLLFNLINGNSPVYTDPQPSSVAIIEDLPAREFLKSRGSYCVNRSPADHPNGAGLCCGGHACDLVITHRDLMRYSLCRICLNSFWKWLNEHVDWWSEPESSISTSASLKVLKREDDAEQHSKDKYGICFQCKAGVQNPHSPVNSNNRLRSHSNIPKAASDMICNRLKNANSISSITHSAPDIIGDKVFENRLLFALQKFQNEHCMSSPSNSSSDVDNEYDFSDAEWDQPDNKRRKVFNVDSDSRSSIDDDDVPSSFENIAKEAADLARLCHSFSPNELRKQYSHTNISISRPVGSGEYKPLEIFNYVGAGMKVLQPMIGPKQTVYESKVSTDKDLKYDNTTVKASVCCSCGRLVAKTFPVDPQSNLSKAVCADIVLVNNAGSNRSNVKKNTRSFVRGHSGQNTASTSQEVDITMHPTNSSSFLTSQNGVMYLVQSINGDSVFTRMERSITDAVVELMVDEHGSSTTTFKDTTYRICRWELSLCGTDISCSIEPTFSTQVDESYVPMPANIAVSYHTNNLIIPHSKIFNDSSIQLSKCGRLLAAIVVPKVDKIMTNSQTPNDNDTFLAVYRLEPSSKRGQCLYGRRFSVMSPICVDFSPSSEYLIVGFATHKIQLSESSPERKQLNPLKLAPIARIFKLTCRMELDTQANTESSSRSNSSPSYVLHRVLEEVSCIQHPSLTGMCANLDDQSTSHRQHTLSLPMSISVNSILWNPKGGIMYGTTKGLIVILAPRLTKELNSSFLPSSFLKQFNEESFIFMEHLDKNKTKVEKFGPNMELDQLDTNPSSINVF